MTDDKRPPDWEWVKAIYQCSALVMFGELKALARRDLRTRNEQLGREAFKFADVSGVEFMIVEANSPRALASFRVTDDLARISVVGGRTNEQTVYTVGLDDNGICRFQIGNMRLDAWQVLKAALEPILFGG
jgi:hypothetical protein